MTYDENRELIRGLWPHATIPQAMADLFRERLEHLDQDALAGAIKSARVESKFPTPELRDILDAYNRARRLEAISKPKPVDHGPKISLPKVDPEVERKVVAEARSVIRESRPEAEESIKRAIWRRWEANDIGSGKASGLLADLHLKIYGGPGMRFINKDGVDVRPEPTASDF